MCTCIMKAKSNCLMDHYNIRGIATNNMKFSTAMAIVFISTNHVQLTILHS